MTTTGKASDVTRTELRKNLKVGLLNAKNLFDDKLIDETELKRLKNVEICKYEAGLATLPSSTASGKSDLPDISDTSDVLTAHSQDLKTPPHKGKSALANGDGEVPSARRFVLRSAPQLRKRPRDNFEAAAFGAGRHRDDHTMFVEPAVYARLFTPPILRRQRRRVRRVVMPVASWRDGLQQRDRGNGAPNGAQPEDAQDDAALREALWQEAKVLAALGDPVRAPATRETHAQ